LDSKSIIETCKQAIDECNAIIAYTNSIDAVEDEKLKAIYTEIRHDELGHLQKHTVALTALLNGEDLDAAEQMDSVEDGPEAGTVTEPEAGNDENPAGSPDPPDEPGGEDE
jgi:rubrerythrin